MTAQLLAQTAELLDGCACDNGCPSCVGPVGEVGERGKEVARRILGELMGLGLESVDPLDHCGAKHGD